MKVVNTFVLKLLTLQKTHENIRTEQLLTFTKKTRENILIDQKKMTNF